MSQVPMSPKSLPQPHPSPPMLPKKQSAPESASLAATVIPAPETEPNSAEMGPFFGIDGDALDRVLHFLQSRATLGLSPTAIALAYLDWSLHLAASPGKQIALAEAWARSLVLLGQQLSSCLLGGQPSQRCICPREEDKRFLWHEWQHWPFDFIHQSFLMQEDWWQKATTDIRGVTGQHERLVSFMARQSLDMVSPANFVATNPKVLQKTLETGGANLVAGAANLIEDWIRTISGAPPVGIEKFKVGQNIATTPGRVVYRNELIELIQYEPRTASVKSEPVLIVPAWIMKYYILDLSPKNSLVKYLVDHGYTVFMISWRNPTREQRDLGLHAYMSMGVEKALAELEQLVGQQPVHAVGYCLGGTLLAMVAAMLARGDGARGKGLKTLTLLAAQIDFTDAGELMLFTNSSQLAFLEDVMEAQGYLEARQMAGAFQMLRSNDLIWSRVVHNYLMGVRKPPFDLMAWNADATRMPAKMHAEYLRHMFLNNDLAEGRYVVDGSPIAISDIRAPIFAVGTETDHVAPWPSVYKIRLFSDTEVTFLLTSGGHNAGIVSPPGHKGRHYRMATAAVDATYVDPESWKNETPPKDGSWWPAWVRWLDAHSSASIPPPRMGSLTEHGQPECAAPGKYVLDR